MELEKMLLEYISDHGRDYKKLIGFISESLSKDVEEITVRLKNGSVILLDISPYRPVIEGLRAFTPLEI